MYSECTSKVVERGRNLELDGVSSWGLLEGQVVPLSVVKSVSEPERDPVIARLPQLDSWMAGGTVPENALLVPTGNVSLYP